LNQHRAAAGSLLTLQARNLTIARTIPAHAPRLSANASDSKMVGARLIESIVSPRRPAKVQLITCLNAEVNGQTASFTQSSTGFLRFCYTCGCRTV